MSEHDLLLQALVQAQVSDELVRAPALLRIARVQTASDPVEARRTFHEGLDAMRRLPEDESNSLSEVAGMLAAAVAPDLLGEIPDYGHFPPAIRAEGLVRIMLDHGHVDDAVSFVTHCEEASSFPFGIVAMVMYKVDDEVVRLSILRRAATAWRAMIDQIGFDKFARFRYLPFSFMSDHFLRLFEQHWKLLPGEEALGVVHDIVNLCLKQPDVQRGVSSGELFTSRRQSHLFQILHILRRLDPALADSLIASHEQLAAAAHRYPNGIETIQQEAEARRAAAAPQSGARGGGGYYFVGRPQDFPYMQRVVQASEDGDFAPSMEDALERYRKDTAPESPNGAAREFWPSNCAYRHILYSAGKRLGSVAAAHLDRIPDVDLRRFAQIELAAALAGLPELQGIQRG